MRSAASTWPLLSFRFDSNARTRDEPTKIPISSDFGIALPDVLFDRGSNGYPSSRGNKRNKSHNERESVKEDARVSVQANAIQATRCAIGDRDDN